jgi:tRNA dimethylallyltransferase
MPSPSPNGEPLPRVIFLIGPTAAGKSELAIALARRLNGEIVSADSRTLYRGMDIGTGKPSPAERSLIPHHLIDVTDPDKPWSLADFTAAALECFRDIAARGKLPFCVGGTGQYVRALLEGWEIPPAATASTLRTRLEERVETEGPSLMDEELKQRDPDAAARIDPRNIRRLVRALEVLYLTGRPFSSQRRRGKIYFRPLILGLTLPRAEVYARADARIDRMLEAGWVDEVRRLLEKGFSPDLPPFSALGYGPIVRHLRGELTLEECIVEIRRATRRLVRHQANWFRPDDPAIHWIVAGENAVDEAEKIIREISSAASPNSQK